MSARPEFEILYREHYSRVLGLCRRLLNSAAQAEDATQEAFMRAYNKFDRYDHAQPFWQWVATIANNYCIDLLRRRSKETLVFDSEADQESEALDEQENESTINQIVSAEDSGMVNRAIAELPEKYRIPLIMAYHNEASYDDIAATLDVSRNHVGVLLLRAKQNLRKILELQNPQEFIEPAIESPIESASTDTNRGASS